VSATADVSVIIPFHNRAQYIDEAIRSVQAQTIKPLEIIVVNDGSQKAAREHLDRWTGVCRIIDLKKNVGPSAARNEGIQQARGQFIAFLDDDDMWLPQKLEIQLQYLHEHPNCALVNSTVWTFSANEPDSISTYLGPTPLTLPQALTEGYYVILSTCLVRTKVLRAIGGFDASFRACEDQDIVIRLCAAGHRIEGLAEPLSRFRREGHERITKRNWLLFRTDLKLCWKHGALYYRVFGLRGIVSFLLHRLHFATRQTRYLDGRVRFLLRVFKVKYQVRANYQEPAGRSL
jgi:glycosyltransferase involved in cell wall biosynthesis